MQVGILKDKIILVTGASRGMGKGIAKVLGEYGATVLVTGRSSNQGQATENLPGTIEETAALVTASGGVGISFICDHRQEEAVEELFKKIKANFGRLDVLVNNVWGGYERYTEVSFDAPFWEQPLYRWDNMFDGGVKAHFTASRWAAPLMIAQGQGVIINISAGDRGKFLHSTIYDTAKNAVDRLAFGMAQELRKYQIPVLSLHPGFTRTERVLKVLENEQEFDWDSTHSPEYTGRGVVHLLADPQLMKKSGQAIAIGDLAREYNFTDLDGRLIAPFVIPDYQ